MSSYRYKALDERQQLIEGEIDAPSELEAFEAVHRLGLFPIEATEGRRRSVADWLRSELASLRRIRLREVVLITKQLASLLAAGIVLERALAILATLTETKQAAAAIENVRESVTEGSTLADAMERYMPNLPGYFTSMVRAGELGGTLAETFGKLSEVLQRQQITRENVSSQLVYPVILLVTVTVSLGLLIVFVLPQFEPVFRGAGKPVPAPMAFLMGIGTVFERYGWAILIGVGVGFLALRRLFAREGARRALDAWLLRLPVIGPILVRLDATSFARTLGTLLSNGVSVVVALGVAKSTAANSALRETLGGFEQQVREGASLTQAMERSAALPPLAARLVRVGEESGALEDMLLHAAEIFEREAEHRIQRLVTLMTPLLTIVLGIGVAAIMSSILVAILSVNELAL